MPPTRSATRVWRSIFVERRWQGELPACLRREMCHPQSPLTEPWQSTPWPDTAGKRRGRKIFRLVFRPLGEKPVNLTAPRAAERFLVCE